jgi:hypothetical protein
MTASTYPVHVRADLDPALSRWQWLVKWILVIPHYLVLAFLWLAFLVLSVVAFFAILFTGRYPRSIFEFNVGVLRWSWRVAYYAYGALGTDRYPPFSLHERPDYPAHLEIDYPDHLSRGLVLVKWWLLAIPHYIVVGFFLGGAGYAAGSADPPADGPWLWSSGLIALLVLVAGVVLLFTGRYPQPVFDFVLGMNRWVLRVAAYAGLMTDRYPPFRLDQGGSDPSTALLSDGPLAPPPTGTSPPVAAPGPAPGAPPPPPPGPPPPAGGGWTAGRVVGVVLASLLVLASLGLTASGTVLLVADHTARDDAGFLMSPDRRVSTETHAITSETMEVHIDGADWVPDALVGDLKVAVDSSSPVFLGIAPAFDVDRYLGGVGHATVEDLSVVPRYQRTEGGPPVSAPGSQTFWTAQTTGADDQAITFELEEGDWTLVLMNSDGSAGVDADVSVGAEVPALGWLVPLLLAAGLTGLLVSAVLLTVLVRGAARR